MFSLLFSFVNLWRHSQVAKHFSSINTLTTAATFQINTNSNQSQESTTTDQKSPQIRAKHCKPISQKMNAATKAWIVATSIGAVEALKDQGICRWNHTIRSLHQHAKNNMKSLAQVKMLSSPARNSTAAAAAADDMKIALMRKREKSMEKVMGLSAWGPTTVRF